MLAILSSSIDLRAIAILGMEAPGQLPGQLSLGLRSHSNVIEEQIADVLTKPLSRVMFKYFREKIDVL